MFLGAIRSIRKLTPTVYLVQISKDRGFSFSAGQHLKLTLEGDAVAAPGYFSIASGPEDESIDLIVRESGQAEMVADRLIRLQTGHRVGVEGPFGKLTFCSSAERRVCFIAQGTGVAPWVSMLKSKEFLRSPPLDTLFLTGFRDESEWIRLEDLGALPQGVRHFVTLSQAKTADWPGYKGRVTDLIRDKILPIDWQGTDFYLCGSLEMVRDVKTLLVSLGVQALSIFSD